MNSMPSPCKKIVIKSRDINCCKQAHLYLPRGAAAFPKTPPETWSCCYLAEGPWEEADLQSLG